ncbi:MAG: hypothetical protein J4O01_02855, partial [Chloroflexi bacterium]|nr:hypothetical protein [Chloroflexota bacterium]
MPNDPDLTSQNISRQSSHHDSPARPHHPEPIEGPRIPPRQRFTRPVEFVRYDLKTPLWGKQA